MCHLCQCRPATEIVKCKLHLSCDGEHTEFCIECAQVYDQYRAGDGSKFSLLQARVPKRGAK